MSKTLFVMVILYFSVFSLDSALTDDDNSKDFFKGLISQGLHNKTWNDPIINYVNSSNFNVRALLTATKILMSNYQSYLLQDSLQALSEIAITFDKILDALFPIIGFSLRFHGIRARPPQYESVFNILNKTFFLYANDANVASILHKDNLLGSLNQIDQMGNQKKYFSAGLFFEELTEKISFKSYINSYEIDINLSNASSIIEENYHDEQLMVGLLIGLGAGESFTEEFITKINSNNFNQHKILQGFNILSQNSFNFETISKDEESFVETVGSISSYLKNTRDLAQIYGSSELQKQMNFVFALFYNHQVLLTRIKYVLQQNIDIRKNFKAMYIDGEVIGDYEKAGKDFAIVCSLLNNQNTRVDFLSK